MDEIMKHIVTKLQTILGLHQEGTTVFLNDENEFHREDGPAIISPDGSEYWYMNGLKHRINGPAEDRIIHGLRPNEIRGYHREWWINGKRHRLEGPAIEYFFGKKEWYFENCLIVEYYENELNSHIRWEFSKEKAVEIQWQFIKANPEQILIFKKSSIEQQEWVINVRPDLIAKIPRLYVKLKKKYQKELNLSGIEV
jgi:hypothetical protein